MPGGLPRLERATRLAVNGSAAAVVGVAVGLAMLGWWWHVAGLLLLSSLLYVPHWLYHGVADFSGTFTPRLKYIVELILTTLILLNVVGYIGLFNVYLLGLGYDTLVHFFGKLLVLLLLSIVYVAYRWHAKRQRPERQVVVRVMLVGGLIMAFGWELLEWFLDVAAEWLVPTRDVSLRLSGQPGEPLDTVYDLAASLLAMVVGALVVDRYVPAFQHWRRWRDFFKAVRPRRRGRFVKATEAGGQ